MHIYNKILDKWVQKIMYNSWIFFGPIHIVKNVIDTLSYFIKSLFNDIQVEDYNFFNPLKLSLNKIK
jgi:hypothetical protein